MRNAEETFKSAVEAVRKNYADDHQPEDYERIAKGVIEAVLSGIDRVYVENFVAYCDGDGEFIRYDDLMEIMDFCPS